MGQHLLPLGDGPLPLEAEGQVVLHLLDAHPTFFQADQILDPLHIPLVKDPPVVAVPLDVGDQALVAVILQRFVGHVGLPADLHHGIHTASLLLGEKFSARLHFFAQKGLTGGYYRIL